MKKILILLLTVPFWLTSCNDLDVVPLGSLTGSNFPKTDNDAIVATNGVYIANADLSSALGYVVDLPSDATQCGEAVTTGSGASIGILQYGPDNGTIDYVWTLLYNGISNGNSLIDNLSASDKISEPLKTRLINEAKFLRALYYFYGVQLFGDIPLVLHPTEGSGTTRANVDAVYAQIVKDLTDATALPASYSTNTDKGRPTSGTANGLLSKVYLTWAQTSGGTDVNQKYTLSIEAANKVTGYVLESDFLDNWNTSKRNGQESLFTANHLISQLAQGDGGNHLGHCAFATEFTDETPHLVISDTIQFYDNWDSRDQRRDGTYAKYLFNPNTGKDFRFSFPRYRKYIDTLNVLSSASNRQIDRTILRYADVLLIKAEAINELNSAPNGEAYDAINQVRRRAYKKEIVAKNLAADAFDFKNLSYESFRDSLRNERLHEFTYEQSRWFDLVRWKILVKTLKEVGAKATDPQVKQKANVEIKNYRFPIPQSQRNINPDGLWQNYGYSGSTVSNPYDVSYK